MHKIKAHIMAIHKLHNKNKQKKQTLIYFTNCTEIYYVMIIK